MNNVGRPVPIAHAWESLRGDPMPWLLDEFRPNLHWRVLVEFVRRPPSSPAVIRTRGAADAVEPIASLLADLNPDGTWATDVGYWKPCSGPGWRIVAAVQWGADPTDPRLHAAAERFFETAAGEGGFARGEGGDPVPWLTARMLHALAELGWCRHPRFQEGLAWLEEEADFDDGVARGVTAAALLGALSACPDLRRPALRSVRTWPRCCGRWRAPMSLSPQRWGRRWRASRDGRSRAGGGGATSRCRSHYRSGSTSLPESRHSG